MERDAAFDALADLGALSATLTFYGGNDEGYIETILFTLPGDEEKGIDEYEFIDLSDLQEALERPIWDKYSGFAGDYSVNGTLTWDVASRKVIMEKSETEWVESKEEV